MKVVIYNQQPIAFAFNGVLNWYEVIQALIIRLKDEGHLGELLRDEDKQIYKHTGRIQGVDIPQWICAYNLTIWKFYPITKKFERAYYSNELKH